MSCYGEEVGSVMSVHIFNYTDRKDVLRIGGDDPELVIKTWQTDDGMKFEPIIKIDEKRGFPKEAKIKMQAYSTKGNNYVSDSFDFGTVEKPELKSVEIETGVEGTLFSFRIVDDEHNILCLADGIKPKKGSTLLEYAEDEQDMLFKLSIVPDQIPIVYFKKGFGLKTLLNESNFLRGFIFTPAIKDVLTKYLMMPDEFEDCHVKKDWIKHFTKLCDGEKPPKKDEFWEEEDDSTKGELWINKAIDGFTNKPNPKKIKLIDLIPDKDIDIKEKLQWKK